MESRYRKILLEYLPAASLDIVVAWLDQYPVSVTITRKRNSKMGDYRAPFKHHHHRISVNGDLHPLAFLVTLTHEIAHMMTWERYHGRVQPHGIQWKNQFRSILKELTQENIFTRDIWRIVNDFSSGKTSYRIFTLQFEKKIHELSPGEKDYLLGELPMNAVFSIHNGRIFIKKERMRVRYRCQDVKNGRIYLISPLAKVHLKEGQR